MSYNAAGVLAHIASDGPEAWNIDSPSRANVLQQMVDAIDRWDMKAERNINYRSFEPILGLLRCYHTPECQLWAIWALANLTNVSVYVCKAPHWINCYSFIALQMAQVYPNKYSSLVVEENGLELLNELLNHPTPNHNIKSLAQIVLDNACRATPQIFTLLDG